MNVQVKPTALPTTREDLLKRKTMAGGPNLNDDIDRLHVILWDNPAYRRFLEGVFDADTVEGSKQADDFEAAAIIREYCKKPENDAYAYIGQKNKQTLVRHLHVVLRRYHMTRAERAQTVAGEIVPNNGNVAES